MTRRLAPLLALAAALLSGASAAARAQGTSVTGAINVSANILYPALNGSGVRPLDFGTIIPGAPGVTIAPMTPSGGEFRITGVLGRKSMNISFTLPTGLAGPGGATIPLDFNGNYAALCELDTTGTCMTASVTTWNPVTTPTFFDTPTRWKKGRPRYTYDQYEVYLGGKAMPAAGQRAGRYTGTLGVLLVLN